MDSRGFGSSDTYGIIEGSGEFRGKDFAGVFYNEVTEGQGVHFL